ncbi:MAG: hypothetical protein WA208_00870 [Thermoanaerobaculia bacterium]
MIREAIEKIEQLAGAQGRPAVLELEDDSGRALLYRDDLKRYEPLERVVVQTGEVSNVESFGARVLEEARRRNGSDGSFMTVTFRESGATFDPDDRVARDRFRYSRTLSPQWQRLEQSLGKPLEHAAFVRVLQGLRPSIVEYDELMRQCRKITFSDRTNIVSEPLLQAGQNANEYAVQVAVTGGGGAAGVAATALPSQFGMRLQYARGSAESYPLTVEIDLTTVPKGTDRKELRFVLIAPDLPNVVEQAIADELAAFREQVEDDLPRLLILEDF